LVLLYKAWGAAGDAAAQQALLRAVLQAVPAAGPAAGAASLQLFYAANQLLKAISHNSSSSSSNSSSSSSSTPPPPGADMADDAVAATSGQLFTVAAAAAAALAAHPCAVAYQQLQQLMELQGPGTSSSSSSGAVGYWLELSPCDVASGGVHRKPPNTAIRLDGVAAEVRFGDKQVGGVVWLGTLLGYCV
jgi:hypothetical protein